MIEKEPVVYVSPQEAIDPVLGSLDYGLSIIKACIQKYGASSKLIPFLQKLVVSIVIVLRHRLKSGRSIFMYYRWDLSPDALFEL